MTRIEKVKWIVGLALIAAAWLQAADKDIELTRNQGWLRIQYNHTLNNEKGLGLMFMSGTRVNFSVTNAVNGVAAKGESQGVWMQEFTVGPTWKRKLSNRWSLSVNLTYRPQFWYVDGVAGERYLRHTVSAAGTFRYTAKRFAPLYRLMLWNHFKAEDGDGHPFGNEFYSRHLLGVSIPVTTRWALFVEDEIFIKHTAHDDDRDGTEIFNRNVIWAGLQLKAAKGLSLKVESVLMSINKAKNRHVSTQINDRYLLLWVVINR